MDGYTFLHSYMWDIGLVARILVVFRSNQQTCNFTTQLPWWYSQMRTRSSLLNLKVTTVSCHYIHDFLQLPAEITSPSYSEYTQNHCRSLKSNQNWSGTISKEKPNDVYTFWVMNPSKTKREAKMLFHTTRSAQVTTPPRLVLHPHLFKRMTELKMKTPPYICYICYVCLVKAGYWIRYHEMLH